ncbi:metallophosphoesterase [Paraburkholderia caribensis]|uniref:metallophosphoesterase n=1 Tax=Paraburkholderia caribensis TaxID=75105 RepID=UPI001D07086F|nr:metallophosphoesterase [Paraburkholderia caribensis]
MTVFQPVHRYDRNSKGRDFVVGDLHGCFSMLDAALKQRSFDPTVDRLFSVGDLIDRGEESPALLDVVHRHLIKAVRGNHEQGILDWMFHEQRASDSDRVKAMRENSEEAIAEWMFHDGRTSELIYNGGQWFIELYCSDDDGARDMTQRIVRYVAALPYAIEIVAEHGLVGIVHSEVPCQHWFELTRSLDSHQTDRTMCEEVLWDRRRWKGREASTHIEGVSAVIVGHTPTHEVAQRGNVINIDTGAVFGNKLTILDLADIPEWLSHGERPITYGHPS